MSECTCTPTDPKYWFTHYGAVEPGSAMEPNPDCLEHFGHVTPEAAEEIAKVESQWIANGAGTCGFEL